MTDLACPSCGNTDVAFDWDGIVTMRIQDGVVKHIVVGGVFGSTPSRLFCGVCEAFADSNPCPGDLANRAGEVAAATYPAGEDETVWFMREEVPVVDSK